MYYFVREVYSKDTLGMVNHAEGFCKELEFTSEPLEGRVNVDGYFTYDLAVGDNFIVDSKPEYKLKCIRFLV